MSLFSVLLRVADLLATSTLMILRHTIHHYCLFCLFN